MVIPRKWKVVSGSLTLSVAMGAPGALANETQADLPDLADATSISMMSDAPQMMLRRSPCRGRNRMSTATIQVVSLDSPDTSDSGDDDSVDSLSADDTDDSADDDDSIDSVDSVSVDGDDDPDSTDSADDAEVVPTDV